MKPNWKNKFIFVLIVYFAGFATAIYCLAPVSENHTTELTFRSEDIAQSFNSGMHKTFAFSKDIFWRVNEFAKQKVEEHKTK